MVPLVRKRRVKGGASRSVFGDAGFRPAHGAARQVKLRRVFASGAIRTSGRKWVDGEVTILTPASFSHQSMFCLLDRVMGIFARHNQCGGILDAPFMVRLPEHVKSGREPDIIFVRQEQLPRIKETYFDGAPDVTVEIVSPESATPDRKIKFGEYQAAGVKEYWLIDPDHRQPDFFRLGADGRYHLENPDKQGVFRSTAFPGFRVKTDWLWQDPLPFEIDVLREMDVL